MRRPHGQFISGIGGLFTAILALACASGCVTQRGPAPWQAVPAAVRDTPAFAIARQTVREAFPPVYRATQRAIIRVGQRQFVCDGLLTASPAEGWHLALISTLGLVTDVRVKADGATVALKVTPLFREEWAREYVARELHWIFIPPPELTPAGCLSDGRLLVETESRLDGARARYACSPDGRRWEELEVLSGSHRLLRAKVLGYRSFPGWPRAVPAEIEIDTATHQLHVRITALSLPDAAPTEGVR